MQTTKMTKLTSDYHVNGWLIEPKINRISRGTVVHKVEPRIIRLLTYMANRQNETCTKEELITNVWEGVWISENTLSGTVRTLRKLLVDDWKNPQFIETVSKSGYRLIGEVRSNLNENGELDHYKKTNKGVALKTKR